MAGNTGGPWGGGGSGGNNGSGGNRGQNGSGNGGGNGGGRGPGGEGPQIPEIDELVKKGQEQLRVLMGGRGGNGTGGNGSGGNGSGGPAFTRGTVGLGVLAAIVAWGLASFYTVKPEEQSVELFLGEYSSTGNSGLNFAPWPFVTAEVLPVTREQTVTIGSGSRGDSGLMLTTDENIIDIDFQVVWNISDAGKYLFNLAEPEATIAAVAESAMREVIARRQLAPILNRDRGVVQDEARDLIQRTLDQYDSGVKIVRLNLDKADPPREVIDSFREVQAAEQVRDRLERQADAYANQVLAGARGEAASQLEQAEAYRAQQVNEAQGEAARFTSVLEEYSKAPDVTRKRLYLETMEKILGDVDKIILEDTGGASGGGQGVVPYLPLNELRRGGKN